VAGQRGIGFGFFGVGFRFRRCDGNRIQIKLLQALLLLGFSSKFQFFGGSRPFHLVSRRPEEAEVISFFPSHRPFYRTIRLIPRISAGRRGPSNFVRRDHIPFLPQAANLLRFGCSCLPRFGFMRNAQISKRRLRHRLEVRPKPFSFSPRCPGKLLGAGWTFISTRVRSTFLFELFGGLLSQNQFNARAFPTLLFGIFRLRSVFRPGTSPRRPENHMPKLKSSGIQHNDISRTGHEKKINRRFPPFQVPRRRAVMFAGR